MHALFHIKTVIIPIDPYRPEGFSPRIDIGRGMITVLIWKRACINLFITYFNIELKKKNFPHRHQTYFLAINIEGKIGQLTVRRISSFINKSGVQRSITIFITYS
jgi:hypothetical protein